MNDTWTQDKMKKKAEGLENRNKRKAEREINDWPIGQYSHIMDIHQFSFQPQKNKLN